MGYDTGLADRIRAKGVQVVEVAGWQFRGNSDYDPDGAVHHHTASGPRGATPSLATVIHGRPGIPGPLCNVLQSREANPAQDKAYVIAAGRANHAGKGNWNGLVGNRKVGGLEVEHTGTGRVSAERHEISCRILAALIEAPGSERRASNICQHAEWAPTRKIDFRDLSPWTPHMIRQRVAHWVGRSATFEEDDMNIDELRKELTTGGTPTRTAIKELTQIGLRESLTTPGDEARSGLRDVIAVTFRDDPRVRDAVEDMVRDAVADRFKALVDLLEATHPGPDETPDGG